MLPYNEKLFNTQFLYALKHSEVLKQRRKRMGTQDEATLNFKRSLYKLIEDGYANNVPTEQLIDKIVPLCQGMFKVPNINDDSFRYDSSLANEEKEYLLKSEVKRLLLSLKVEDGTYVVGSLIASDPLKLDALVKDYAEIAYKARIDELSTLIHDLEANHFEKTLLYASLVRRRERFQDKVA